MLVSTRVAGKRVTHLSTVHAVVARARYYIDHLAISRLQKPKPGTRYYIISIWDTLRLSVHMRCSLLLYLTLTIV